METSESLFSENDGEIYRSDSAKEDMKYMEEASIWIGSLSIVFSLVFVWNAVELGTYSILISVASEYLLTRVLTREYLFFDTFWDSSLLELDFSLLKILERVEY